MSNMHILAALNGSDGSDTVADWAADRGQALGADVTLVHVTPPVWAFRSPEENALANKGAEDLLNSAADRLAVSFPGLEISSKVISGEPGQTLAGLSASAGLLVVGTDRRPGAEGQGYGSVSFQIAVTSRCPVAVIPHHLSRPSFGVVVGVDGSRDSVSALELAAGEAQRIREELVIVHALPTAEAERIRNDVVADSVEWVHAHFPEVNIRVRVDPIHSAADALAAASSDAKLLVIGRKGRGGLRVLLGSVAERALLNVRCPTLLALPA